MSRRFFAPEVIQTSAMDCGPASLKCLLDGHRLKVSYGRLREACQTTVDGTSIDTLEDVAVALGLEAEQIMVPLDHLLMPEADTLPALVVVQLPNGLTHFVVVWRRLGPWLQIMDPGSGRHWVRAERFLREVYVHAMPLPAEHFREWGDSEDFLGPLRVRLGALGIGGGAAKRLVDAALEDASWKRIATLDAATRTVTGLVESGAIGRGDEAERLIAALLDDPDVETIPRPDWTAFHETGDPEAEEIVLTGAVLIRVGGVSEETPEDEESELPADLAAVRTQSDQPPVRALWEGLREDGLLVPSVWLVAMAIAAAGVTVEALLFRGLLDLRLALSPGLPRFAAAGVLLAFLVGLVVLERPLESGILRMGRRLECRLRLAFLRKIPRLADQYFRSRLHSDMAERCHALANVRMLPQLAGSGLRAAFGLLFTAAGIAWLVPSVAGLALLGAALSVVLPLLLQPLLTDRDLRLRTHGAGLTRFYLDALLGLVPIRAHGAQRSVSREHEGLLTEWVRSGLSLQRLAVAVQGLLAVAGLAIAASIVIVGLQHGGEAGQALLLVFWALRMPAQGAELATVAQQYPAIRNVVLRVCEPLGAPEEDIGDPTAAGPVNVEGAVAIELDGVEVRAGGHTILEELDLSIAPGEHVAIVGLSGAGKSSLAGLLLGWHRAAQGRVRVDGQTLDAARLARLRLQTAWIDPDIAIWNRNLDANIRYGNDDDAGIVRALEVADLRAVVERLPDGMQTSLGEAGRLVSGGEGQRVRTARAVMRKDARLAILDEAFRGLDRGQRRRLTARVRKHWDGVTMLFITHDVADTTEFDRVLVIEDGRVLEDAAPAELMQTPESRYRELVEAEREAHATLWTAAAWTRMRVEGGRVQATDAEGAS
jgi:ATP-binding cassette subfamily B protein